MDTAERGRIAQTLRAFAEERLNASAFPDCTHAFTLIECDICPCLALRPTLERHPGDEPGDFRGLLHVACTACGRQRCVLGVTAYGQEEVQPVAVEQPACPCGGRSFYLGQCERWEDWGFFDEGTVVAQCTDCGALRVLLDTD